MAAKLSPDPRDRMGIYQTLSDVPPEKRLKRYADDYENEQTYRRYLENHLFEKFDSDRLVEKAQLAGRRWRAHMSERGRHHALATPSDVEAWMCRLLDRVSMNTAYNTYWVKLERFYCWLQRRVDHPHSYHPFLMAAAEYPTAADVWDKKLSRWDGGDE